MSGRKCVRFREQRQENANAIVVRLHREEQCTSSFGRTGARVGTGTGTISWLPSSPAAESPFSDSGTQSKNTKKETNLNISKRRLGKLLRSTGRDHRYKNPPKEHSGPSRSTYPVA
jgi:hypothetical protein